MKRVLAHKRILAGAAVLLLVAGLGYLVLVGPKRSKASSLETEIAQTELQLAQARIANRKPKGTSDVADLFRLTKAVPNRPDMPGLLLELSRVARNTGVSFDSITPQTPTASTGYQLMPIGLTFRGNYYQLSDFLFRLRNLVAVHSGRLNINGRLFTIDTVQFDEDPDREFPYLEAKLTANAVVFGTAPIPGAAATGETAPTPPPAATPPPPAATPPATPPPATSSGPTATGAP